MRRARRRECRCPSCGRPTVAGRLRGKRVQAIAIFSAWSRRKKRPRARHSVLVGRRVVASGRHVEQVLECHAVPAAGGAALGHVVHEPASRPGVDQFGAHQRESRHHGLGDRVRGQRHLVAVRIRPAARVAAAHIMRALDGDAEGGSCVAGATSSARSRTPAGSSAGVVVGQGADRLDRKTRRDFPPESLGRRVAVGHRLLLPARARTCPRRRTSARSTGQVSCEESGRPPAIPGHHRGTRNVGTPLSMQFALRSCRANGERGASSSRRHAASCQVRPGPTIRSHQLCSLR